MASWEPVGINQTDRDGIDLEDEYDMADSIDDADLNE